MNKSNIGVEHKDDVITLDADVLRWENQCENPIDEMCRVEAYKSNRRLRYVNAKNAKLALLAIKEKK